jgi:ABC-type multidrug transport system ATPase subunit
MDDFAGQPVVAARGVVKRFRELAAVDDVSFEIQPNECVAFLGPNGAGKTTLMRMVYSAIDNCGRAARARQGADARPQADQRAPRRGVPGRQPG